MIRLVSFMSLFVLIVCFEPCSSMAENADYTGQYRLDAEDEISIIVRGENDLSMTVPLDSTGVFNYPYLGKIRALHKTVMQIEDLIRDGLSGDYLVNPHVEVSIVKRRPFFIYGEVNKPGMIPYQPRMTLHRALVLASGLTARSDTNKIFVVREGDPKRASIKINMDDPIYPGDSITIGTSYFFITGEVAKRGKFAYQTGLTFRMAATLAGGFTERADEDDIEVVRKLNGKTTTLKVKPDDKIMPGDVITVKQSFF